MIKCAKVIFTTFVISLFSMCFVSSIYAATGDYPSVTTDTVVELTIQGNDGLDNPNVIDKIPPLNAGGAGVQTGDNFDNLWLYQLLCYTSISLLFLLILVKRKKEQENKIY